MRQGKNQWNKKKKGQYVCSLWSYIITQRKSKRMAEAKTPRRVMVEATTPKSVFQYGKHSGTVEDILSTIALVVMEDSYRNYPIHKFIKMTLDKKSENKSEEDHYTVVISTEQSRSKTGTPFRTRLVNLKRGFPTED